MGTVLNERIAVAQQQQIGQYSGKAPIAILKWVNCQKSDHEIRNRQERMEILILKRYIFDTGALVQHFAKHPVISQIYQEVVNGNAEGLTCYPLLTEFFYQTARELGFETAQIRFVSVERSPIKLIPLDSSICLDAGKLKIQHSFLSLADSFALSLARKFKGTLLTTDGSLQDVPNLKVKKIEY